MSDSCAGCHGRPRGAAGFGGDVATRPDSRDAPHLFGLGIQELLAGEITRGLRRTRAEALARAVAAGGSVTLPLVSKGIEYGSITANANGSVDTSGVEGVNPDLRVRPFFAEGSTMSMREFIVGAFNAEMGLQSPDEILCAATDSIDARKVVSPAGFEFDPENDTIERPPVCSETEDGDGDGVTNEIDTAVIDHLEFYLLNYFKPATGEVSGNARKGPPLMRRIGCTECHVQSLMLEHDRRIADVETVFDPDRGIFNRLFATATLHLRLINDGHSFPLRLPEGKSFQVENIFTDFKRHDLGPNFHEREYDGSLVTQFITEPLWGVGTTAPYGHDGRSINLKEVILRHGGEAQASRDAFARLSTSQQKKIMEFLGTLVLFPPDDTASNLNPGDPQGIHPQDPAQHGSVNLQALFQIESEGAE